MSYSDEAVLGLCERMEYVDAGRSVWLGLHGSNDLVDSVEGYLGVG